MPSSHRSLVDLLRFQSDQNPSQTAFVYLKDGTVEEQTLTFPGLDQQARALGATLQKRKYQGERCLMIYPPGLEFLAAFMGCLYAGAVAVPAYPPRLDRNMDRLVKIAEDCRPKAVLTTRSIYRKVRALIPFIPRLRWLKWIVTDDTSPDESTGWSDPGVKSDALCFLQYTSGSTSAPKGVRVSHGNLLANMNYIAKAIEADEKTVGISWLPHFHDMGLIGGILVPMYLGHTSYLMSPLTFLKRPIHWLKAIDKYQATCSPSPNFGFDLTVRKTTPEDRHDLDLSSWRVATNGAEPVRAQTIERFEQAFGPCGFSAAAHTPVYGLAEATLMVTFTPPHLEPITLTVDAEALETEKRVVEVEASHPNARELVSSGRAAEPMDVRIVDPETRQECEDGVIGELWVGGSSVADGYWNNDEATSESFEARLAEGSGPFLRSGDLAFRYQGYFYIAGRAKDLIIIRGRNYYPQDIEIVAEAAHEDCRPGCSAAFSLDGDGDERLVVAQEMKKNLDSPEPEAMRQALSEAVASEIGIHVSEVLILKPDSIPKTSSGKIQRQATKLAYLKRKLDIVD